MTEDRRPTAPESGPDRAASGMRPADVLFILVTSFAIAFTVLWGASVVRGHTMFDQLPSWLAGMVSSVWTQLTGAAGALAAVVRYLRSGASVRRNYLLSCSGGAVAVIVAIIGTASFMPPVLPAALSTHDLLLEVTFDPPSPQPMNLNFIHLVPEGRGPIRLAPQRRGNYITTIKLAQAPEAQYKGLFQRLILDSERRETLPVETDVCFTRGEFRSSEPPRELVLACHESKGCTIPAGRNGGVRPCTQTGRSGDWLTAAYAQSVSTPTGSKWVVPTLETLKEAGGRKSLGYTVFTLESGAMQGLQEANGMIYRVRVNGRPIYFNGWEPERLRVPFDPTRGIVLEFGLQNLDFAGAKAGAEEIEVSIDLLTAHRIVRTLRIPIQYVALRDAGPSQVVLDGVHLRWRATYARPQHEHKFEIFLSTDALASAAAAEARKRRVDAAQLRLDGRPVLGVIRPPLPPNRNFGIVLGLEEPTGQVRFTFDEPTVNRLCHDVIALARVAGSAVSPHAYRYEMEPRAARVPATRPCRTL